MKYIDRYDDYINESFFNKIKIKMLCYKYGIKNYTINNDGTVDVDGDVNFTSESFIRKIKKLPIKFNNVNGSFDCANLELETLEGCPRIVKGDFICKNNYLKTLEGGPEEVGGFYFCKNNELTSLKGAPNECESFNCQNNELTSLKGAPSECESFNCQDNYLTNLKGCPQIISESLICSNNKLTSLEGAPVKVKSLLCQNNYNLETFKGCPKYVDEANFRYCNIFTLEDFPDIDPEYNEIGMNPVYKICALFKNKPDNFLELFNFYEPIKLIDGEWTVILEVLNQVLYETNNKEIEPEETEKIFGKGSKYKVI